MDNEMTPGEREQLIAQQRRASEATAINMDYLEAHRAARIADGCRGWP